MPVPVPVVVRVVPPPALALPDPVPVPDCDGWVPLVPDVTPVPELDGADVELPVPVEDGVVEGDEPVAVPDPGKVWVRLDDVVGTVAALAAAAVTAMPVGWPSWVSVGGRWTGWSTATLTGVTRAPVAGGRGRGLAACPRVAAPTANAAAKATIVRTANTSSRRCASADRATSRYGRETPT